MNLSALFIRAVKSGCICSIFYHVLMVISGQSVTIAQAAIFTVVFIVLYFFWLALVSHRSGKK